MDNTINNLQTFDDDFTPYAVELKEGQLLGENRNYRLEKNLGAGGMGEVWLASEIRGGVEVRKVVVKTLRADRRGNEGAQAKALKQFQLIQKLNHQNICPIYVIEQDPACGYLIVMGYADGGSYADWFAAQPKQNGGLPLKTVCDVLRPIADALDFAHRKGVIHRDVKPENMMFTSDGTPWLIDFGIAANLRSATQATQGQFSQSGTVSYMAPEQRTGDLQTAQTDEYSLALVALEFLTGTTFFQAIQLLATEIQKVLNKGLALKPSDRYPTCRAFIDALAGTALPAQPIRKDGGSPSAVGPTAKKSKDLKWVWLPAFLILLLVGFLVFNASRDRSKPVGTTLPASSEEEFEGVEEELPALSDEPPMQSDTDEAKPAEQVQIADPQPAETTLPASLKPGSEAGERKVLTADGIDYAFRWCPPGEFMMGSANGSSDEKPVHKVKITRGFWLLETEVTQAMWQSVMGSNPSWHKGVQNPVEQVCWDDCQEFCEKLSQKLGQTVKLPTEAQWEYACRSGTTGDYAGTLDEMGWYAKNSGSTTHAVGQKKPNAWGLYDMHGNVWEWCSDYRDENYYSKSLTSDPENTTASSFRVLRGGSWSNHAEFCRSAYRRGNEPESRINDLGLRVLLVPGRE